MRTREEILGEKRALLRGNRFVRDDFHRNADRTIEKTAAHVRAQLVQAATHWTGEPLDRRNPNGAVLLDCCAAWALTQPAFMKEIHRAIDENTSPTFDGEHSWSELTREQLDAKVAAFDKELEEIELEGKRSEILSRKAEVEAELKALKLLKD